MPTSHAARPTPADAERRGRLHAAIPDVDEADLAAAVREFEGRERRFGGRPQQRRTEG